MKIFISYGLSDEVLAKDLATRLSTAGYEVLFPTEDLLPGDNVSLAIGEALERADGMVVLLSPQSVQSQWMRRELQFALGSPNFEHRLIPVVIEPTDQIPWILRKLPLLRAGSSPAETARRVVRQLQHAPEVAG
jgi:TIR domain